MSGVLTSEDIERYLVAHPPADVAAPSPPPRRSDRIDDAGAYLREHGIAIASERHGSHGEHIYVLAACVWDPAHTDHAAIVEQWPDGRVTAKCSHHSCADKKLAEFRDTVEGTGWRTARPAGPRAVQSRRAQALSALDPLFHVAASASDALAIQAHPTGDENGVERANASASDQAHAELFHDAGREVYMTVPVEQHHETLRIGSRDAKDWVRHQAFTRAGVTLSESDVKDILDHFAARARFDGPVREVASRVWQPDDATIWLDLGDDTHQAVRITPAGWSLHPDPPVKFVRKKGSLPLPTPTGPTAVDTAAGALLERILRPFLNIPPPRPRADAASATAAPQVPADHDWVLVVTWLLSTLRPRGPFAVLQLKGEKGTAKSTLARVLRRLVDPHQVSLEPQPGSLREMAIAAQGSWVLAYDNLSQLTTAMSNALCMVATGGGFRTRALFTDDEEAIFSYQRPVLLTGIAEVVVRPDLLDRTITVTLPMIPKSARKPEERFWRAFDAQQDVIFGALLSVLSQALAALPTVPDQEWPRLADFARWACAVEVAMGWPPGAFMAALASVEAEAMQIALDSSPIAALLLAFLNDLRRKADWRDQAGRVLWRGTMSDLLGALKKRVFDYEGEPHPERTRPGWPKGSNVLSRQARDIAPYLRESGLDLRQATRHGARDYEIVDNRPDDAVPPEPPRGAAYVPSFRVGG
jgi:hypothetical protein